MSRYGFNELEEKNKKTVFVYVVFESVKKGYKQLELN